MWCGKSWRERSLAQGAIDAYSATVSTVTEIKQAVQKLPPQKKMALARWLYTQVDNRLSDEEMMHVAAEGARALDRREAADAKRRAR